MIVYGLLPVLSYLVGAIPIGFLLVRGLKGVDLRKIGSGNLGATNAARALGARWFFPIFALDFLKGFGPSFGLGWLATAHFSGPDESGLLYGIAAIAGHVWPVYLRFKGGKGVATATGAVAGIAPAATGIAFLAFLAVFAAFRYVSLGSITAAVVLPAAYFLFRRGQGADVTLLALVAIAALVVVKHRSNIRRLLAGTEPRVTRKSARKGEGPC